MTECDVAGGFYVSVEEARDEIKKRWNDPVLRKKVEEYLNGDIPDVFGSEPRAVLFRNVIMLDFELYRFHELAEKAGLSPLGLEYICDKFCTRNSDKLCYGEIPVFEKRDKNGGVIMRYENIIDVKKEDGKKISDIRTFWGDSMVDFHHNIVKEEFGHMKVIDMSAWLSRNGSRAKEYYKKFFMFFICYGVLFEKFVTSNEESSFFSQVILPSFNEVKEIFGVKPMIVCLYSDNEIEDRYWGCSPTKITDKIEERNKQ